MDVGKRITQLREARSISTNKLANKAGVSQSYLREIEMGKKNPTVEVLSYICDALNLSLKEFFNENACTVQPFLMEAISYLDDKEQLKLAELIFELKRFERNEH